MKRIYTILVTMALLMAIGMVKVNAQVVDVCAGNDVVELHLGNFQYGYVQWQVSEDNEFWSDIDGAVDTVYRFLPERPQYYRAEVRFPNCTDQNYYSQVTYVQTPPRAYAGPDFSIPAGMVARLCGSTLKETEGEWRIIEGVNGLIEDATDPTSAFVGEEGEYKLTWTLTNSCGSNTDTVVIRCVRMAYQPNVVYVDETDAILSDSTQLVNGEYVVVFSNPVPDIQVGTVLLGYRTPSFLRKVTSFERNGDLFVMQTEQGLLTDVILSGALYMDPIGVAEGEKKSSVKYIDHYPTRKEMLDNPFLLRDGNIYVIRNMSQGFNEKNDDFEITAEIEDGALSLGVMLNLGMWQEQLDGLIYDEEVRLTPNLRTNISIDEDGHLNECYLGLYNATFGHSVNLYIDRPLSTTTIADHGMINSSPMILAGCLVGTIPVTLTLDFPVAFNISAAINGLQLSFASTTHFTNAIEYDNQSHEFIKIHEKQEPENLPGGFELNGTLGLDFQAGVKLSILLAGVTGPYVEWRGTTNPSICTSLTSPYQVNADLNLGFDMDLGWRFHLIKDLLEDDASMNFKLIDHKEHAPGSVKKYLGDNQVYTLGNYLPIPITVDVEGWFGTKLPHARVYFEPEAGSVVTATEVITDMEGKALTLWKPNHPNGRDQLKVRAFDCHGDLIGGTPVVFHAFSSATDPCLNSNLTVDVYHVEEGRIIPQVSGGREPYMYSIDGESFSIVQPNIQTVPGHNYTFYVQDADGCEAMASYNEPFYDCENSGLTLTVAASGNVITATGYFGQEPYEYSIDGINYQSTGLFMPLLDGEYTIYVRDALDCVDTKHVTVSREGNLYVWISEIDGHSGTAEVVTSTGSLTDRGVCWSTHHAPTVEDLHASFGQGAGSFPFTINGLDSGTTYYVRAYALDYSGTSYSEERCINPSVGLYLPEVVATGITSITQTSAVGSGNVVYDGGAIVTERGICWGTNHNPGISGSHIICGSGIGAFTGMITSLTPNTQYYARAYAINSVGTAYGDEIAFTTGNGGGETHEYVDLGLPSGTLWATCNVGANSPEEYGNYFAWGETQPKDYYDWSSFKYCKGSEFTLTKYCWDSNYGYNGFTDTLTILESGDDAAIVNWGNEWCVPTVEQWEELCQNTNSTWIMQNGVYGRLFVAPNGNSLFMPATGYRRDGELYYEEEGFYWLNTIDIDWETTNSTGLYFNSMQLGIYITRRCLGFSVRPVHSNVDPIGEVPEGAINGLFSVAPDYQVYFSQGNLQYQPSSNTWRFATNQYDLIHTAADMTEYQDNGEWGGYYYCDVSNEYTESYSGWIDMFGWGTSGNNHGAVCYQPWSISENDGDYIPYGNLGDYLNDQTGQADWGSNAISNGGNVQNYWRTLTASEWHYLFETRVTSSGIRYVLARVNQMNGLILLPDDWNNSYYALNYPNQSDVSYSDNTITAMQWEVLEQHGAVFLPAAGGRYGTSVLNIENAGGYWSASHDYVFDSYCYSYHLTWADAEQGPSFVGLVGNDYSAGLSVRLVNSQLPSPPSVGLPQVITSDVSMFTPSTAILGGEVVSEGGVKVTEFGVCWGTSHNPTVDDSHVAGGNVIEAFKTRAFGLTPATTYYVRAYATNAVGTAYANEVSFTTLSDGGENQVCVDLGLPSGTLWATCNVGANVPEGYGDYFAWGETHPKGFYNWSNYQHCMGSGTTLTKYCNDPNYGYNGYTDTLTVLQAVDDAATANWGTDWRTPTQMEWNELNANTAKTYINHNGVEGWLFTASNGNGLFIPDAGSRISGGVYWSCELVNYLPFFSPGDSWAFYLNPVTFGIYFCGRPEGLPVRPVRATLPSNSLPCVTTSEVSVFYDDTAECGGNVLSDGGSIVTERGICWSTSPNPTIDGYHASSGSGVGAFTVYATEIVTAITYYARAYAINAVGIAYGNEVSFMKHQGGGGGGGTGGECPEGGIDALFTINENEDMVYFSQGNLQYQASTNTWRFAENQWDYVGEANSNISPTYDGWIDLFGWGTSGYNHGAVCYQPWSTSQNPNDYAVYGNWQYNLYDQTGQADWGYNAISNGGNTENSGWRTLNREEWIYVIDGRNTVSGARFAKASVGEVKGLILLPDNWQLSTFVLNNVNQKEIGFQTNIINISEWSVLEANGAVFFPVTCARDGSELMDESEIGPFGAYWGSSLDVSGIPRSLLFRDDTLEPDSDPERSYGIAVRLVYGAGSGSGSGGGGGGPHK